jgi:hypothetical protein
VSEVVPYLAVLGCLGAVLGFFTWLKGAMRRRGVVGSAIQGALASCEEGLRITSHDSHYEIRAQADRRAPMASPDDPPWRNPRLAAADGTWRRRYARRGIPGRRRRWFSR